MSEVNSIPYTRPSITRAEIDSVVDAVTSGWGIKCYDRIREFESRFAEYLNVEYVIATSSCTGALHMGLAALGIGPGSEVILADTNWIATVSPISHLGAEPVFVDILPDTWCIDPEKVEEAITSRTKAIVVTHLYGNLCTLNELKEIGEKYGVPIVEDAAEALGATYHGRRAGSIGDFGVFSFHGTKTLTTGEGGAFVTNNRNLYERVLTLSNHGRVQGQTKQFWPEIIGYKYKMSNIEAALGCAQLERIEELVLKKREILAQYKLKIGIRPGVSMNPDKSGCELGAWMPTVVFDETLGIFTETLQQKFARANIDARVFFPPLSSLPMFRPKVGNRNSWSIPRRSINLPSFHDITLDQIDRVCEVIQCVLNESDMSRHSLVL